MNQNGDSHSYSIVFPSADCHVDGVLVHDAHDTRPDEGIGHITLYYHHDTLYISLLLHVLLLHESSGTTRPGDSLGLLAVVTFHGHGGDDGVGVDLLVVHVRPAGDRPSHLRHVPILYDHHGHLWH